MTLVVDADKAHAAIGRLQAAGERIAVIGEVEAHDGTPQVVYEP